MLQDDLSLQDDPGLAAMADTLARSTDYRVLRRLIPRTEFAPANGQPTRSGILLDVETTGLDQVRDEVIELAMIKFDYLPDGSITRATDIFTAFNEPSRPIPPEITTASRGYTTHWSRVRRCWSIMLIALLADRIAPSCQAPTWLRCSPAK